MPSFSHRSSVLVPWRGEVIAWSARDAAVLGATDFEAVAALSPELVVFGSGVRIRFPRPAWIRPLVERRIGIETMDTAAACRTYNVLLAEGRVRGVGTLSEFRAQLVKFGMEPVPPQTPEQFAAVIQTEQPRWIKAIRDSGAKVD